MEKFKVTFYPGKKSVEVEKDTTILSAAISAGILINSSCGGEGVCGRCKVTLKGQPKVYLACMTRVQSNLEVDIPPESMLDTQVAQSETEDILIDGEDISRDEIFFHSPLATKMYLEITPPGPDDRSGDLERLYRNIQAKQDIPALQTGLINIKSLGKLLRDSDWKVTVTLGRRNDTVEVVLVEPSDTAGINLGLCFDIGTTTISGQLIDLDKGAVLGTKTAYNKQASFGSDVITRIIYSQKPQGLEDLHNAAVDCINQIIRDLAAENKADLNNVTCIVLSGNTTMTHLLLSIDPQNIRKDPYVPAVNFVPVLRAAEAGIKINPRGLMACLPSTASYVGGDITAGILYCGLDEKEELSMLIDIGTNGEIVIGNKEFLVSAAASAGPAFEGSGVSCGMRAGRQAIQKVEIDEKNFEVKFDTIGGVKPSGICGSGYISLLAQMLKKGVMEKDGKLRDITSKRVRNTESGKEFVVVFKEDADAAADIVINEVDIENLKRAKAAIYSAAATLIRHVDMEFDQLKKIYIAGGFGTYIDVPSAIAIGLLPCCDDKKFIFVGNSSLSGSRQVLLSYEAMKKADEIARKNTCLELSVMPEYMDEYMAALFFPHTHAEKFI